MIVVIMRKNKEEISCENCEYNRLGCQCENLMAASCIPTKRTSPKNWGSVKALKQELQKLIDILASPNMGDEGRKAELIAIKAWQIKLLDLLEKEAENRIRG